MRMMNIMKASERNWGGYKWLIGGTEIASTFLA